MKRATQNRTEDRSPEALADLLLLRIFRGDYPAGSDLPAERQLAIDLGVDRTSLRMALKQLQRMRLLVPRHGSGIRVTDWRAEAGLDAIAAMFSLPDLPLEGSFIVEALDFWIETLASMVAKATVRMSLADVRAIETRLDVALADPGDRDAVIAAVMEIQDVVAAMSGSVFFHTLSNSTRAVRARICRLLVADDIGEGLDELRGLLRTAALTRPTEELARTTVLGVLRRMTAKLRERLLFGEPRTPAHKGKARTSRRRR